MIRYDLAGEVAGGHFDNPARSRHVLSKCIGGPNTLVAARGSWEESYDGTRLDFIGALRRRNCEAGQVRNCGYVSEIRAHPRSRSER